MEEEARELAAKPSKEPSPYEAIRKHIEPLGGIELELPPRELPRDPPTFDE